jgi:hypothetical protein
MRWHSADLPTARGFASPGIASNPSSTHEPIVHSVKRRGERIRVLIQEFRETARIDRSHVERRTAARAAPCHVANGIGERCGKHHLLRVQLLSGDRGAGDSLIPLHRSVCRAPRSRVQIREQLGPQLRGALADRLINLSSFAIARETWLIDRIRMIDRRRKANRQMPLRCAGHAG